MDKTPIGFRKLIVWQQADELVREIYLVTRKFPADEVFGVTSQLRRAALSVPLNIVEGYARQSRKSFSNFLAISYGSLMEVQYLMGLASDFGYLNKEHAVQVLNRVDRVGQLLWRLKHRLER